jgi:hypothetical protein
MELWFTGLPKSNSAFYSEEIFSRSLLALGDKSITYFVGWKMANKASHITAGSVQGQGGSIEHPMESNYRKLASPNSAVKCRGDVMLSFLLVFYMTTHQQDSSQPQQSHDSPQETEDAMLAGMLRLW